MIRRTEVITLTFGLLTLGFAAASHAQDGAPPAAPEVERSSERASRLGAKIRCPVCQGMPIAESPSKSAQDMMGVLRDQLATGKSDDEILDFFVARYGEWVLLEPKARGFNLFVWFLPPAALLIALGGFQLVIRRGSAASPAPDPKRSSSEAPTPADSDDPYLAAIREEVDT